MATTVLVPLDGWPLAEQALPYAEDLARRSAARLLLLHVAPAAAGPEAARGARASRAALAYLDAVAARLAGRGVQAEVASDTGEPAAAILRLARLRRVDVVVLAVGSRFSAGWQHFGSLADRLLRHARVPVLLVPAPDAVEGDDRVLDVTWRPAPVAVGASGCR